MEQRGEAASRRVRAPGGGTRTRPGAREAHHSGSQRAGYSSSEQRLLDGLRHLKVIGLEPVHADDLDEVWKDMCLCTFWGHGCYFEVAVGVQPRDGRWYLSLGASFGKPSDCTFGKPSDCTFGRPSLAPRGVV